MTDQDNVPPPGTPRHSGVHTSDGRATAGGDTAQPNLQGASDTDGQATDRPSEAGYDSVPPALEPAAREPAFNLPSSLVWILTVLVVIHAVRMYLLSVEIDDELIFNFAFLPARYDHALSEQGLAWLWTPVTYSFLHGSWEHLIFNAFWMLAFGAPVVRRIGAGRLAVFWCLSAIAAVGFHLALHWGDMTVVIGASGVVAGLMGAAARFVFSPSGRISRQFAHRNPRLSIREALSNRSVLFFAGVWFATNLLIGLGLFTLDGGAGIAWEAHIGGFLFGFLFFGLIDPPTGYDERVQQD
ncbi:rhomboid family intramembrane serine protease [Rhizobium sp. PP-CC-3G-465]|uniref:rhomboid family intramembrane serine protease n=1 Tax=Rhizobium sp. PP-CC-3G-465 TaxID=2135648 RepID=UPI00104FF3FB|nr:membrane associated rhomboid family serine protease [Rhizobium sp. PP-CC-3G-465]